MTKTIDRSTVLPMEITFSPTGNRTRSAGLSTLYYVAIKSACTARKDKCVIYLYSGLYRKEGQVCYIPILRLVPQGRTSVLYTYTPACTARKDKCVIYLYSGLYRKEGQVCYILIPGDTYKIVCAHSENSDRRVRVYAVRLKTLKFGSLTFNRMPCEDTDQTARMRRVVLTFAGRTCNLYKVGIEINRLD